MENVKSSAAQLRLERDSECDFARFSDFLECAGIQEWRGENPAGSSDRLARALEDGKVLFAPNLRFDLRESERRFLSPAHRSGDSKNIGFDPGTKQLSVVCKGSDREELAAMLARYSARANAFVKAICPAYREILVPGLTSFRPAEISGRTSSWRKDDTRIHVDAFPSRPSLGRRMLRVFMNAHETRDRRWEIGESFEQMAGTFMSRIRPPVPGSRSLPAILRITKGRRTLYDHYMLGLHDAMMADSRYRSRTVRGQVSFAPGIVWACFTDLVPHAAISGPFAFEQTFYLPVSSMLDPSRSPLRVLERLLGTCLV